MERFRDRADAGRRLAAALAGGVTGEVTVLALPRGGVPVAVPVAEALGADLDVLVVRKVGHPTHPEVAIGAVAEGGVEVAVATTRRGLAPDEVAAAVDRAREELAEAVARLRGVRHASPVADRTVVVVDDGLATGATARVALQAARQRGATHLVLAVPVAARSGLDACRDVADEIVAVQVPDDFRAVGQHYDDFTQTTDAEVRRLLGS